MSEDCPHDYLLVRTTIVIDLLTETSLSLTEAARLLPCGRRNRKPHLSTLLRWVLTGAKSATGELVRLEALRLGGRWVTTREALQRFAERLTPSLYDPPDAKQVPRLTKARQRASERAATALEKLGI
jgi:hypothetical protein